MSFAQRYAISDVCLLVADADRAVDFYVNKLGFILRRRAEGFADFKGAGLTLAIWEMDHISRMTGISNKRAPGGLHKVCVAIRMEQPSEIDQAFAELSAKGVTFTSRPSDYPWNARCTYFLDPDDNLWELYAWHPEGPKHDFDLQQRKT
jgi:hypothetical protein